MNEKTPWDNQEICKHILNTNFPKLKDSNHFAALNECVKKIDSDSYKTILDIGCCKAELAETFPQFQYTGADLPNIIEGVSKKIRPSLSYVYFNAETDDYSFISNYDIIVMNSFLSEMPNGTETLNKILNHVKKYVVIHRQDIEEKTTVVNSQTYGGMNTVNFVFSREDINKITNKNDCKIIFETQSFSEHPNTRSLVISR